MNKLPRSRHNQEWLQQPPLVVIGGILVGLVVVIAAGYVILSNQPEPVEENPSPSVPVIKNREGYLEQLQNATVPKDSTPEEKSEYLLAQAEAASVLENYDIATKRYLEVLGTSGQGRSTVALTGLAEAYEAQEDITRAKLSYKRLLDVYEKDFPDKKNAISVIKEKLEGLQ